MLAGCLLAAGYGLDEAKRNPVTADDKPLAPSGTIEVVIELDTPPGKVTVAASQKPLALSGVVADERVFFTF